MSDETDLVIGDLIFPAGSGRGITQSLEIIDNGELRRTVNGDLVDTTRAANRKFTSSISCSDMDTPTLAGIWKGSIVTVECITKLQQLVAPAAAVVDLIRTPVVDSIRGYSSVGALVPVDSVIGAEVTFTGSVARVEFLPIIEFMVETYSLDEDEYGAVTGWSLSLEEV